MTDNVEKQNKASVALSAEETLAFLKAQNFKILSLEQAFLLETLPIFPNILSSWRRLLKKQQALDDQELLHSI